MSSKSSGEKSANPDNPYNIDFARERRLKKTFQLLIGGAFVVALILLVVAYAMDTLLRENVDGGAPVTPYSTPAQATDRQVAPK
ncbi:MAG: hypothetical protein HUU46_00240 [Candidatus Hydrogenedentes bacterium]|nr:hypothetical protein [Candidatus Hydrogenedentota bacterium]